MQKLAQFGYCYAAALLVASVLGAGNLAWCFPVLLILLIVGLCVGPLRSNQTFWCIVSAAVLAFGAFFCYTRAVYEPMERLEGRTVTVKAMVEDYNSRYGMYNYEIKLLEVDGHAVVPTGAVYSVRENLDASYGDMIETQMKFTANRPAEGRVLGDYYKSHGLFLKSYLVYESDPKVSPVSGFNLQAAFHTLRDRLSDSVRQYICCALPARSILRQRGWRRCSICSASRRSAFLSRCSNRSAAAADLRSGASSSVPRVRTAMSAASRQSCSDRRKRAFIPSVYMPDISDSRGPVTQFRQHYARIWQLL